ncbi:MAG: AraC family transcriptional regulator [Anaerolineaceae bacterium]|nr:AraC family transcriptional regulator [Anaerolineaceae bacterium]
MEPTFVKKPAFLVVGTPYFGKNEHGEIPQMWNVFNSRYGEIKEITDPTVCYGICSSMDETGAFEYVAAAPVNKIDELPEGMVARMVSEQEYAVFIHAGALDTLGKTYDSIYQGWLPNSGYEFVPAAHDFELYDQDFKFGDPDSKMYIYIPVRLKS